MISAWAQAFGPLLRWLTPSRRRLLLSLLGLIVAVRLSFDDMARGERSLGVDSPDPIAALVLLAALIAFVVGAFAAAKHFASLPSLVRRHPQLVLHAILWSLLALLWTTGPGEGLWRTVLVGCAFALPFLLWRVGYMMFAAQRGKMAGTGLKDHFFYLFPVATGTDTPFGKGHEYLSANEARDEMGLARSQLAGMKLFLLAGLWALAGEFIRGAAYGESNAFHGALGGFSLGLPRFHDMVADVDAYPLWRRWISLYVGLVLAVLHLAATTHVFIGWLRLFGFYIFRNTYKPLLAESVVDFWGRYYYYFKELLVNFFFYPVFARHFKKSPRLRMFAAVFAAAFVGNLYYHWLRIDGARAAGDFAAMWDRLQSRAFYCLLLATGIYVSMRREQQRAKEKRARGLPRKMVAIFGVWTFFSIIHIWIEKDSASFAMRSRFFLALVGLA